MELTQAEADALLAMQKRATESRVLKFPAVGERLIIDVQSLDQTEDFLVDVSRSRIDLAKITYQHRARVIIILMRLDLNGAPHRNPDGEQIACPHAHLYREGFGDKWAYPLPMGRFENLDDQVQTLFDFMAECNVIEPPSIQRGFF
jgi:hypothetical protein